MCGCCTRAFRSPLAQRALQRGNQRAALAAQDADEVSRRNYRRGRAATSVEAAASLRDVEQRPAIGAAPLEAGQIAAVVHCPAIVEPVVIGTGHEDAPAICPASAPARVRDAD